MTHELTLAAPFAPDPEPDAHGPEPRGRTPDLAAAQRGR